MSDFSTVFEYTAGSVRADALHHVLVGAAILIGAILVWIYRDQLFSEDKPALPAAGLMGMLVCFALGWWVAHMNLFLFAVSDIAGNTRVTEGVVHVLGVQAYHGHNAGDKITVGDEPFEVNYFGSSPGYKQTLAHNGALDEGVHARIHHCNGIILKVEVKAKNPGARGP